MNLQQVAGIVIIAGFVLLVLNMFLNMFLAPPRLYQETDIEEVRLKLIADHQARWQVAQWVGGIAPLMTGFGFLLLSIHLQGSQNPWPLNLGAATILLAGLLAVLSVNQFLADPRSYLDHSIQSPVTVAYLLLTSLGGFLYGIAFLQGGFPTWLGYLTLVSGALVSLNWIFKTSWAYAFTIFFYIVSAVVGVVLLRL